MVAAIEITPSMSTITSAMTPAASNILCKSIFDIVSLPFRRSHRLTDLLPKLHSYEDPKAASSKGQQISKNIQAFYGVQNGHGLAERKRNTPDRNSYCERDTHLPL